MIPMQQNKNEGVNAGQVCSGIQSQHTLRR
jgi:hypothetical protein